MIDTNSHCSRRLGMYLRNGITLLAAAIATVLTTTAAADSPPDGNRYYSLPRYYKAEISVSGAYLAMEHSKDFTNAPGEAKPVLIDVRSLREYASGHPEDAYNVPFPTVSGMGGDAPQDPLKLYWEVYRIVGGRMDTPIMTLCRTGHRSVLAGNILANPESDPATKDRGLQPFTNVRNIWEGFVGQPKYAFKTGSDALELAPDCPTGCRLDLNNDGQLNADAADVYSQTKDANPDKDGWRNFAALPWTTQVQPPLAYERDPGLYKALNLTPVQ
ncbi:rhodanese-like domain-containing protein [Parasulfuritortus cantonensis]|uniref:rhodanese-like domain-containing protein n=1 Tax=Parasulfuritortus cantonensis TaxID=2528202 RepID=UPI001F0E7E04|nr:rhodanese-like domain-containing protein [Parasulfuritortus cantonensis]